MFFLAPRSPQVPPDALISSSKDVVSQVGGLVSAVGPVLDTVKGLLDGLPGGTAVEGLLDGLGIQLAATKKSADQLSSLVVQPIRILNLRALFADSTCAGTDHAAISGSGHSAGRSSMRPP